MGASALYDKKIETSSSFLLVMMFLYEVDDGETIFTSISCIILQFVWIAALIVAFFDVIKHLIR